MKPTIDYKNHPNTEKIQNIVCTIPGCGEVTANMYKIRRGFTLVDIVCSHCYNEHYSKLDKFTSFTKNDSESVYGSKGLVEKQKFMRLHTSSEYVTEEERKAKAKEQYYTKKQTKLSTDVKAVLLAGYISSLDPKTFTASGVLKYVQCKEKSGKEYRAFFSVKGEDIKLHYLMDKGGTIIKYF